MPGRDEVARSKNGHAVPLAAERSRRERKISHTSVSSHDDAAVATPASLTDAEVEFDETEDSDVSATALLGSKSGVDVSPSRQRTTVTTTAVETTGLPSRSTTVQYTGASSVSSHVGRDGVLHIRPVQARKGRKVKVKKIVNFVPRISTFDRFQTAGQGDTFWGFYVLFWLLMSLALLRMFYHSYLDTGVIVGVRFAKLISADGVALALTDATLVGSTCLAVPFVQAMERGWFRYYYFGLVLQHVGQSLLLASAIRWTFYKEWYWVQSGYLTLHTLVMLMKTHSYISFNGTAAEKRRQLRKKTALLDTAVKEAGGWQKVLATVAKQHGQVQEDAESAGSAVQTGSAPVRRFSTGDIALGTSSSLNAPLILQRRRRSASKGGVMQPSSVPLPSNESIQDPRLLVEFGDENIYNLANDCVDLKEDLSIADQVDAQWPANLTYANYVDYLLVPTLVYEQSYPRTSTIRPIYVLEKTLATFGTFFVVYAITEHVIFPTHEAALANPIRANNFLLTALDLVLPFIINYLLIFYIIFECVCNGFAEFTRFADRGFYDDWWNAVTWDEFARKWNKPVHQFLLRHVYASTITAFRLSKFQASFLTFLLSACVHELVMAIVSKKFRMYLFAMQMMQLPLMMMGRIPFMRKYPVLGNMFFWFGLIWGFPLLAIGYLRF